MEDIQPISAADKASFCVELMKRLNIDRKQDYLATLLWCRRTTESLRLTEMFFPPQVCSFASYFRVT